MLKSKHSHDQPLAHFTKNREYSTDTLHMWRITSVLHLPKSPNMIAKFDIIPVLDILMREVTLKEV